MQASNNKAHSPDQGPDEIKAQSSFKITKDEIIDLIDKYKTRKYSEDILAVQDEGGVEALAAKVNVDLKVGLTQAECNTLSYTHDPKNREVIAKNGDGLERYHAFGDNWKAPLKAKSWPSLFLAALDDFMLKVLIVAAIFSITFDMILADKHDKAHAWIEGFAIMIAVMLVAGVGSFVDWKKEKSFVASRQKSDEKKLCVVIRDGKKESTHHNDLNVGDVINVQYGMAIPVDGIVISATQLQVDEAAMTGESDQMNKETLEKCMSLINEKNADPSNKVISKMSGSHELPSPIIMSGTSIANGEGQILCVMVGENSCIGQIEKFLDVKPEVTPLQAKLEQIATDIGKMGTYIAILIVHILLFRYFLEGLTKRNTDLFGGETPDQNDDDLFTAALNKWLSYLIVGVAIIVVAVPEGLPLAVMISLSYSISRMLKDNCDVKRLSSCEIMGGADNICSDKTGTLTMNQMKVTRIWAGSDVIVNEDQLPGEEHKLPKDRLMTKLKWNDAAFEKVQKIHAMHIEHGIACNTAEEQGATDKAMTELLDRLDVDIENLKNKHIPLKHKIRFPFSSKRKRMSTIVEDLDTKDNSYRKRLHVKGASEIVKDCCSHFIDEHGEVKEMDDKQKGVLDNVINNYAEQALRTICLAYKDVMPNECGVDHDQPKTEEIKDIEKSGLTLICIFGIMDIVRPEVPGAVEQIHKAGVTVRMVTGDNVVTAKAIAVLCKILSKDELTDERCCMDGPAFNVKMGGLVTRNGKEEVGNFKVFQESMQYMKVMARSRPEDKYLMVTGLRQMKKTVAVTGDGTNDAPALKKADVGFAMGITGTDVCKQAADILITDDNFNSIVQACMWGRNVYDNIKRFLQFQLTVNVGACIITFVGAVIGKESPLQPIQLLWVNLIMDSLASLALATEMPKKSLLLRLPQNRDDYIVSRKMIKHILGQAIWQCMILFVFLFAGEFLIPESDPVHEDPNRPGWVFPGRGSDWEGNDLYTKEKTSKIGPSRHLTFIFTAFVLMQIFNMITARKINDEWNIFEGIHTNVIFIVLWFVILGGQVIITMFGSRVFVCCLDGLDGVQWLMVFAVGFTSLIVNAFLKLVPDGACPKIGDDSVDDRRKADLAAKVQPLLRGGLKLNPEASAEDNMGAERVHPTNK